MRSLPSKLQKVSKSITNQLRDDAPERVLRGRSMSRVCDKTRCTELQQKPVNPAVDQVFTPPPPYKHKLRTYTDSILSASPFEKILLFLQERIKVDAKNVATTTFQPHAHTYLSLFLNKPYYFSSNTSFPKSFSFGAIPKSRKRRRVESKNSPGYMHQNVNNTILVYQWTLKT